MVLDPSSKGECLKDEDEMVLDVFGEPFGKSLVRFCSWEQQFIHYHADDGRWYLHPMKIPRFPTFTSCQAQQPQKSNFCTWTTPEKAKLCEIASSKGEINVTSTEGQSLVKFCSREQKFAHYHADDGGWYEQL